MRKQILIPVSLPAWAHDPLLNLKRKLIPSAPVMKNIEGERYVEWSFLTKEMPNGPGKAMDFGCENGFIGLIAAEKGFHVLAVDLEHQSFCFEHPNMEFRQGDFLEMPLREGYFDLILNCSSVEHVGLVGRYGIKAERTHGDVETLQRFAQILKPEGLVLMTAPCGRDALLAPWCRVYGEQRLPSLLAPFSVEKERYWQKDERNRWIEVDRKQALNFQTRHDPDNPHGCSYALGGFVLRKTARSRHSS